MILPVALLEREPSLDVYFFAAGAPRSPAATFTTGTGSSSAWRISSSIASRRSCSSADADGLAEDEELDLVELVDAEHPARVLAGGAGFAPEVGREGRVAERELFEDLAHV